MAQKQHHPTEIYRAEIYRVRGAKGLGEALKHFRTAKGWTQQDLAGWLQVDRTTVVRMESGRQPALARLVEAFSILQADLVAVPRAAQVQVVQSGTPSG